MVGTGAPDGEQRTHHVFGTRRDDVVEQAGDGARYGIGVGLHQYRRDGRDDREECKQRRIRRTLGDAEAVLFIGDLEGGAQAAPETRGETHIGDVDVWRGRHLTSLSLSLDAGG